jgi:hypothetical protein
LARNGLKYGKIYGYAVDMAEPYKQSKGLYRDEFHRSPEYAFNGAKVRGFWIAQKWSWDGEVKNFRHDGSWDYQDKPPHTESGSGRMDFEYWTAAGPDSSGCKTEHNTPDPRIGVTGFIQSSTCGYFGHYYVRFFFFTEEYVKVWYVFLTPLFFNFVYRFTILSKLLMLWMAVFLTFSEEITTSTKESLTFVTKSSLEVRDST